MNTHIVVKREHLKFLNPEEQKSFLAACNKMAVLSGSSKYQYYVCNTDEPYADKVLQVILEGENNGSK